MTVIEPTNERAAERSDAHLTLAFEELKLSVEAILFAADRPLEVTEIRDFVGSVSLTDVRLALKDLGHDFEGRSVEILEVGRKYQLRTRSNFAPTVTKLFSGKPKTLSRSALETLAIIAYRQPVTRAEVNALRQVDSSQVMASLRERELIYASGTRKELGSPVEYRTTPKFLHIFGLADLKDLPKLRSLQMNIDEESMVRKALSALDSGAPPEELNAESLALSERSEVAEEAPEEAELLTDPQREPQADPHDEALEPFFMDADTATPGEQTTDKNIVVQETMAPAPGQELSFQSSQPEEEEEASRPSKTTKSKPKPLRIDDSEGLARPVYSRKGAQARPSVDDTEEEGESEPFDESPSEPSV